jgi:alanyl-tRNA synthetase
MIMTSQEIRKHFLDFFRKKNHHILPSAPIVIKYDPTLMFVNAGMNPLKDYFVGKKKIILSRIASTQKCLRVSGKHNDLEDVGKDSYHHTMFEMLGNWYFGFCVKKQAIEWAWELITTVYKIPIDNIYVTIFSGDTKEGIFIDEKSQFYWENFLKREHIIHCKKKHNFWEMSKIGPCGPCSEIHVDLRSYKEKIKIYGKDLINKDHPQIIELWNLVFMEFFRHKSLEKLSERHIDTGMGFERLCRVLQKKNSNYDTDIFSLLIRKVEELSSIIYGREPYSDIAVRVVIDHIRSISFAVADGQAPSNTGAGYVIRRILRRAISYGYRFLFQRKAFLYHLVDILVKEMSMHFSELILKKKLIEEKIYMEEFFFFKTIHKGMNRLEKIIKETKVKKQNSISGIIIFELFDTYGFPMDLSRLLATENSLLIDEKGFENELNLQRERSRNTSTFQTYNWTIINKMNYTESENVVGYDKLSVNIHLSKFRRVKKNRSIYYHIVFTTTPFYAEGTRQVGDKGIIENEKEKIYILNSIIENNIILHITENIPQSPEKAFKATVDKFRRKSIEKNHSAIHLLHYAIKIILDNVKQKGTSVRQDRLRYDFSYPKKLNNNHIKNIEGMVQEMIDQDFPLKENIFFKEGEGTICEKVIRFGPSVELCRGLHVKYTGDIGRFKIISENSVGSGIRRIEAITSKFTIKYLNKIQNDYQIIIKEMNSNSNPIKYMQLMQHKNKISLYKIEVSRLKEIQRIKTDWLLKANYKNYYILIYERTNLDFKGLKTIALELRKQNTEIIIIIGNILTSLICVAISNKLIDLYGMNACKILKKIFTTIHNENANKELAIAKVKNIRWFTETLIHNYNETDFYL